ncbi:MAG: phosphocarrier protein HPr [Chlamydiales bacterium]|nr:phosphocarrier protein HPr [Chlamydiales bacterium]
MVKPSPLKQSQRVASCSLRADKKSVKGVFTVLNDRGLHTRPCTELVRQAAFFKSEIKLVFKDYEVNAKSLLGILMLAAARGSKIMVKATGEDAEDAVAALLALAKNQFYVKY